MSCGMARRPGMRSRKRHPGIEPADLRGWAVRAPQPAWIGPHGHPVWRLVPVPGRSLRDSPAPMARAALCLLLAVTGMPLCPALPTLPGSAPARHGLAFSAGYERLPCCCRPGHCHMAMCHGNPAFARTHPGLMACGACVCAPAPRPAALAAGRAVPSPARRLCPPAMPVRPVPFAHAPRLPTPPPHRSAHPAPFSRLNRLRVPAEKPCPRFSTSPKETFP